MVSDSGERRWGHREEKKRGGKKRLHANRINVADEREKMRKIFSLKESPKRREAPSSI